MISDNKTARNDSKNGKIRKKQVVVLSKSAAPSRSKCSGQHYIGRQVGSAWKTYT